MLGEYLGAGASTTKLLLHLNGNSTDSSGNGNDGTTNGIDYVNGKFGQAASFNATSDYIEIQNESAFDFERNMPFTISLWAKFNSTGVIRIFLSKQLASGNYTGIGFYTDTINKIHTQLSNTYQTNNLEVCTNNAFTDTTNFHNYIWTYNGSSQASGALIYVDGVAQTMSVVYNNLTASILNDIKVRIGNRASNYNFNGIIDEVIWENVVWTPEYIKKYYTYSKGRFGIL